MHTHTHTLINAHTHTLINAHTHTLINEHTHTLINAHTHTCIRRKNGHRTLSQGNALKVPTVLGLHT